MKKLSDKAIALVMYVFDRLEVQWRPVEEIWLSIVEKIMYLMQARYVWEYWVWLIEDKFITSPFWPELKNWSYIINELWNTLKQIKESIETEEWKRWLKKYELKKLFNEVEIKHMQMMMYLFGWFQWNELRVFTNNMKEVYETNKNYMSWKTTSTILLKDMKKYNDKILSKYNLIKK